MSLERAYKACTLCHSYSSALSADGIGRGLKLRDASTYEAMRALEAYLEIQGIPDSKGIGKKH